MSWTERSVRYHKRQTDLAISRAYARIASDAVAAGAFDQLLYQARKKGARLFEAAVDGEFHPGVEALLHLARFAGEHLRKASAWPGTSASWRRVVASLAHHLLCRYQVPVFLASAWYSRVAEGEDRSRRWYVAHSRGASFRSLDVPVAMTRRMEHLFLRSQDHLCIEYAMRRAELSALGVPEEHARAVLSTRLATDLSNGEFWRTVWLFLIGNGSEMDPAQVGPLIDYIQAVRHERIPIETPGGTMEILPPQPSFTMKGRTLSSMLRLMREWHQDLAQGRGELAWRRLPLRPMVVTEQDPRDPLQARTWHLIELVSLSELRMEGKVQRHCVASYAQRCSHGKASIWSLRCRSGELQQRVLTIEVDPARRAVVQARGKTNRMATGKPLQLLQNWADREGLRMAI